MTDDRTRVYRLDITYPEGSDAPGWQPAGWTAGDPGTRGGPELEDCWFGWPAEHLYLSRSGSARRAEILRGYGCDVNIVVSFPVMWNEDDEPEKIPDAEGRRICEAADGHPRRELVRQLAEVMSEIDGEHGAGPGMWWHLSKALALVDALPELRLDGAP